MITNSGGDEYSEDDDNDEEYEEEIDEDEDEKNTKKRIKSTDYGKIATAIGNFQNYGITILPPDINTSNFTFSPDEKKNTITYGLRGITRISSSIIYTIIRNRPYASLKDFIQKITLNKLQLINLIKSGAFDNIENKPREIIMEEYIKSIADMKNVINLRNMQMLIEKNLIPEEMIFYKKLFLFNKYLKTCKQSAYYTLNSQAFDFINTYFDSNLTTDGNKISQAIWDKLYTKAMIPMRDYLKQHQEEILNKVNNLLYTETYNKYATGNVSKWEMDSLSFYYHDHELESIKKRYDNFFLLPDQPEIERTFTTKNGQEINMYNLHIIIGAVINKDKIKNMISLLTPYGVVDVKIYKNQYVLFDKRISQVLSTGKKKVIENSWFTKGTLLMIQGIRRENSFIPKKYKNSPYPVISKIIGISENGQVQLQQERAEVDE